MPVEVMARSLIEARIHYAVTAKVPQVSSGFIDQAFAMWLTDTGQEIIFTHDTHEQVASKHFPGLSSGTALLVALARGWIRVIVNKPDAIYVEFKRPTWEAVKALRKVLDQYPVSKYIVDDSDMFKNSSFTTHDVSKFERHIAKFARRGISTDTPKIESTANVLFKVWINDAGKVIDVPREHDEVVWKFFPGEKSPATTAKDSGWIRVIVYYPNEIFINFKNPSREALLALRREILDKYPCLVYCLDPELGQTSIRTLDIKVFERKMTEALRK